MFKQAYITIFNAAFVFVLIFFAAEANATTVYFDPQKGDIYVGDTFIVEAKISSIKGEINAIDGYVTFDKDKLEVRDLAIGGSDISAWAQPPMLSNENGRISFVGGVPGGFKKTETSIFRMAVLAKSQGEAHLDFGDLFSVFLNDGKGTKENLWLRPADILILERPDGLAPRDEWQEAIKGDKSAPELFEIDLGRNPAVFDNKYFISFQTRDEESGVDYYEVKEGSRDFIRAESPHLLKDQSLKEHIEVRAVDRAGNARISKFITKEEGDSRRILAVIFVGFVLIVGTIVILNKYYKRKTKRS